MNGAKHTPGPWRTFNVTDIFPNDDDRQGLMHIADCAMSGAMGAEEIAANARLIAAAPELLAALRDAALALDGLAKGEGVFKPIEQTVVLARTAIAKAEGRS